MKSAGPPELGLIQRKTCIVERGLVEEIRDAVGFGAPDQGWNCIYDQPEVVLGSLDLVKSLLQLFLCFVLFGDVDICADQLDQIPLAIEDGMSDRMNMFRCSIRKPDPKIDFDIRLVTDCLSSRLDDSELVFREYSIVISLYQLGLSSLLDPEQVIKFIRQIRVFLQALIPSPTARVTKMLCLGQIGFPKTQFALGLLRGGHIRYRADKFDATIFIFRSACHRMDMLHRTVRHQQSILMLEILVFGGHPVNHRLHGGAILGMHALKHKFDGRFGRSIKFENPEGLV